MGYNLFPWLNLDADQMKIHPLTIGNDAYEVTDNAISYIREKYGDDSIGLVESPEMDISDCTGGYEGAMVKMYLIKCRDKVWTKLQTRIKEESQKSSIPYADVNIA